MKWFNRENKDKYSKLKLINNIFKFEDETKPAKITVRESEFFDVKVNKEFVNGEIIVYKNDEIRIQYKNHILEEAGCDFEIKIDEKKQEVKLSKKVKLGVAYIIPSIKEYEYNPIINVRKTKYSPEPNNYDEIESLLKMEGLNGVFEVENINSICISEEDIELVVVTAKDPVPGKPARFELIDLLKNGAKIKAEQFFAEYVEETPGKPGYNIFGVEMEPKDLSFFPDIGGNVMVEDRGLMSLREGRIVFNYYNIDIKEEEKVDRDIDFEDGIVEYKNDVLIKGDVKEGGQIKCNGNVTIEGNVYESYIFADGDIVIKGNVDNSVVYSGFSKISAKQIEVNSLHYLEVFERIMFESSFSAEDGYDYSEKTKSLEMAKSEFLAIKQSIDPFLSLVDQFSNDEIKNVYEKFGKICKEGITVVLNDQSGTNDIKVEMDKFYHLIEESKILFKDKLGSLEVKNANSSHLFGFNDINVIGNGLFQTNVESSISSIVVPGKVLASDLVAETYVEAEEFNPGNQSERSITVRKNNGYLKVDNLCCDSVVKIGSKRYVALEDEKYIHYDSKNLPRNK